MPTKDGPEENSVVLRFGGGVNSNASEDEINQREAASGQNFQLDAKNSSLRSRKSFDLVGTTTNAARINGFVSLLKTDGTTSLLVQSGTEVYEWSGSAFSASKGTVSANARLRGRIEHNWQLTDKVLITDVALAQPVMEWDGTTLQNVSFTTEDGSTSFGTFRAKYCNIDNERAVFGHIHDNGTDTPHLIVGCQRSDYTIITVNNRPASSLSEGDPFFLVAPDNRAINGMVGAYNVLGFSTEKGSMFKLTGSSAKDFSVINYHRTSGASGRESLVFTGNDILYGRQGRIESLVQVEASGDLDTNDASLPVSDQVKSFDDWLLVYNQRVQQVYCFADSQSECWMLHKPLIGSQLSPWSKWVTFHASSFQPTAAMNVYDPADGLEYVFFGDSSGNIYRMEGSGSSGDGGSENIRTNRTSPLFKASLDQAIYNISGWVSYRTSDSQDITLTILYAGRNVFNGVVNLTLNPATDKVVYGGGYYYSDSNYYSSSFNARLQREVFKVPSGSEEFQIKVEYNGTKDLDIQEIGIRFDSTTV